MTERRYGKQYVKPRETEYIALLFLPYFLDRRSTNGCVLSIFREIKRKKFYVFLQLSPLKFGSKCMVH